jgi:hypothetical protein
VAGHLYKGGKAVKSGRLYSKTEILLEDVRTQVDEWMAHGNSQPKLPVRLRLRPRRMERIYEWRACQHENVPDMKLKTKAVMTKLGVHQLMCADNDAVDVLSTISLNLRFFIFKEK